MKNNINRVLLLLAVGMCQAAAKPESSGLIKLPGRGRTEIKPAGGAWQETKTTLQWDPKTTAVIICDVWDKMLRQRGIKHILYMGVHANMCVLGRSFGIRQMAELGFDCVLVRDLTDALYNPKMPPYVSHERGTELVVQHIEKYWCPSALSKDLK